MTFCLGMRCQDGLVAIADTRITSGTELSTAKKISIHQYSNHSMFIMTSGLRSLRDKAIVYFEERLRAPDQHLTRMYQAANALSAEIRRVREEDARWLEEGDLRFDLHCIFGGQLEEDETHHLYLIYPEGNWVEVRRGTPYVIIGESRYGKPILDRVWRHEESLSAALRAGLLSFDATRTSAAHVDYPVDAVLYRAGSFEMREQRFSGPDLEPLRRYWQEAILSAVEGVGPHVAPLFERLSDAPPAHTNFWENGINTRER